MSENVQLPWGVSRVESFTLDLLEDEERRCLDLSVLQCSILRQMTFPWAYHPNRLVEDHGDYQTIVEMPEAYLDALDELMELLSGAYDGPVGGCPVGMTYVDRGDPSAPDFLITDLAVDGAWHSLDLGSVITDADATEVELSLAIVGPANGLWFQFRRTNNVNVVNRILLYTQIANLTNTVVGLLSMGPDRSIDYAANASLSAIQITVRGWWKPAG